MPYFDPGTWNLDIYAGATYSKRATQTSGTVVDFSGMDARAKFRDSWDSATAALSLGTAAGTAVITLGSGYVQLDIDATTTATLGSTYSEAQTTLVWDLEIDDSGDVTKFARGIVTIYPEATR